MNSKNLLLIIILSLLATNNVAATSNHEKELFAEKCSSCHMLEFPNKRSDLKASPVQGMMFQLNQNIVDDDNMLAFIKDFVMNPSEDKAVFNRVRKFGPMPSQKGNLTEDELDVIANWMVDEVFISKRDYNAAKHQMKRSSH